MAVREITGLTPDTHFVVWVADGKPVWVVAMEGWVGQVCGMHFACDRPRMVPRQLCKAVFNYAFRSLGLKAVYGYQDSTNAGAIRLSEWIGFRLIHTLPGGGLRGDLRIVELRADQCRWLEGPAHGKEDAPDA
jgi:hypothetical protein